MNENKSSSNSSPKRINRPNYKDYSDYSSYADEEEEVNYEIETIIKHRRTKKGYEYQIKWKGYGMDKCTWEPASSFNDESTLKEYWKNYNEKQKEEQNKLAKPQENTPEKQTPEKEQKPHQTPIKSTTSDDNKKGHLDEIKGIIKKNGQMHFLCIVEGKDEIISNQKMREKYSSQLIDFYESNIKLTEVVKIESK